MVSPIDIGLPPSSWREGQYEITGNLAASDKPVVFLSAPTGAGKSLIAMALAAILGERTVIATKTINLQDQYCHDFPDNLTRMVGRANFPCPIGYKDARDAICASGGPCELKGTYDCPYYAARLDASAAAVVVVNYDYLMSAWVGRGNPVSPLHSRKLLIADEAHLMDDSLRSASKADISGWLLARVPSAALPEGIDKGEWFEWSLDVIEDTTEAAAEAARECTKERYNQIRHKVALYKEASKMAALLRSRHPCVIKRTSGGVTVEPVMAAAAFRMLMQGFEKIVLMSATLPGPKLLAHQLGLADDEFDVFEMPSSFPVAQRPLFYSPVVKVQRNMSSDDLDLLAMWVDTYLELWSDRKGIVHCNAYWLRDALLERCKTRERMISHGARELPLAVARFRRAAAGTFLLSPSAHSGVDLPYDDCRAQLIVKLPTPDLGDPVVQARKELLPDSYDLAVAATLVQAYGRGMRAVDDACETVIMDKNWGWFYRKNRHLIPNWVQEAIR